MWRHYFEFDAGLSPSNVLFNSETGEVMILDWFRYSLTGRGEMAHFQKNFKYQPPEEIIKYVQGKKCPRTRENYII